MDAFYIALLAASGALTALLVYVFERLRGQQ
jgi:hypothetical protein